MTLETLTLDAPQPLAAAGGHNIIAVASGKGGVGKTWLAITLAHTFAQRGKNALLFDGDLGLANVDIQLGLMPKHDLGEVVDGKLTMKAAVQRFNEGGFDVLAGRSGTGSLATLPSQQLDTLRHDLAELAPGYDWVVLDLAPGVDREVRLLAGPAGTILVVTTDEPTSLTDAYAFIKITRATNPLADLRIVVNMAASQKEGERTYQAIDKACRNFLKFSPPLAGIVRRDSRVRDAIRNQSPLLVRSPNCDAATDVSELANRLASGE
ncbi:MAG TPA: MinD/ParA family protein [Azospirillaceae bacterium]|nr:MinD/ParA family protein [Azospirillaceae bacterium]